MSRKDHLITVEELASGLGAPGLRILDASWYLPAQERNGRAEFDAARIPGARFFDIEAVSEPGSPLPHTLASEAHFQSAIRALGINNGDDVVVYDGAGLFSAARAWWNLRLGGLARVRVLDGGLPAWRNAGLALESGPAHAPEPGNVDIRYDTRGVTGFADMLNHVERGDVHILDARAAARYAGTAAEPRAGLAAGHMPGSVNIPFGSVLDASGHVLADDQLSTLFASNGVDGSRPVITTCGSGVTAAILSLSLALLGRTDTTLYDGSWSEWGGHPNSAHLISRS